MIPTLSLGAGIKVAVSPKRRPLRTHCAKGHPLTPENTYRDYRWPNTVACRCCTIRRTTIRKQKLRGTYVESP